MVHTEPQYPYIAIIRFHHVHRPSASTQYAYCWRMLLLLFVIPQFEQLFAAKPMEQHPTSHGPVSHFSYKTNYFTLRQLTLTNPVHSVVRKKYNFLLTILSSIHELQDRCEIIVYSIVLKSCYDIGVAREWGASLRSHVI